MCQSSPSMPSTRIPVPSSSCLYPGSPSQTRIRRRKSSFSSLLSSLSNAPFQEGGTRGMRRRRRRARGDEISRACKIQSHLREVADRAVSSRRDQLTLMLLGSASSLFDLGGEAPVLANEESRKTKKPLLPPNYSLPGPLEPVGLPRLEHTCTVCDASADRCRIKIQAWIPRGGGKIGLKPPYPVAVLTSGFLLGASCYESLARHLSSWGYVVVLYDQKQAAFDPTTDVLSVAFLRDLLDWCRLTSPICTVADIENTYLIGHSRGAKISTLTAAEDPRVKSLFLIDPVDVTIYAPLSVDYPSATAALHQASTKGNPIPVGILGSGRGGDCVPYNSNYDTFYDAASGMAWRGVLQDAGHLQFIDGRSKNAMDLICRAGPIPDDVVSMITKAMVVAWGEITVPRRTPMGRTESNEKALQLRLGLEPTGELVVGETNFDPLRTLLVTQSFIFSEAANGSDSRAANEVRLNVKAKNFEGASELELT